MLKDLKEWSLPYGQKVTSNCNRGMVLMNSFLIHRGILKGPIFCASYADKTVIFIKQCSCSAQNTNFQRATISADSSYILLHLLEHSWDLIVVIKMSHLYLIAQVLRCFQHFKYCELLHLLPYTTKRSFLSYLKSEDPMSRGINIFKAV